jgi:small subunit ribosomal protein S8
VSVNDPIGDMLTRIRNAGMARQASVSMPTSKMKLAIAQILKREGFIADIQVRDEKPCPVLTLSLKYNADKQPVITGLKRVSKPGLRTYAGVAEIPQVRGGLGISILSTPNGVMAGYEAWQKRIGGEVLCYVW